MDLVPGDASVTPSPAGPVAGPPPNKGLSMGGLSPIHWIIVLVVVLLLFGPGRLAGVGKGLGEGIRSFKKGIGDEPESEKDEKQLSEKSEKADKGEKSDKTEQKEA